jgi:hypothetical protein
LLFTIEFEEDTNLSCIVFSFLIINTTTASASTIIVDENGKGNYTPLIQKAVNNSVDEDTILVNRGVYVENVVVDKKIEIISMSGNLEYTSVQTLNPGDHIFHVTANSVTIKGFGLRSASSRSGIYLDNVQQILLQIQTRSMDSSLLPQIITL